jgi:hypothetical protein
MPTIDYANIPNFTPASRYTEERMHLMDKLHNEDFLWPKERRLLYYFMILHNTSFAWDDSERGQFKKEFFSPVEIPVLPHVP